MQAASWSTLHDHRRAGRGGGDRKHGAALRGLPSGHEYQPGLDVGAPLVTTLTSWLRQLIASTGHERLVGHGVRSGQAMIATFRWRPLVVPGPLDPQL